MAYMMAHQNVDERESVWHIDASSASGLAAARVWPTRPITVEWQDGHTATVYSRVGCVPGMGTPGATFDLTSLDYYVVIGHGLEGVPRLVPITALPTFDPVSQLGTDTWTILRVLGKWGSAPYWPGGAGSGTTLEMTDGTHDLTAVSKITVTGAVVGGTTPNATLDVSPFPSGTEGSILYWHSGAAAWLPPPSS